MCVRVMCWEIYGLLKKYIYVYIYIYLYIFILTAKLGAESGNPLKPKWLHRRIQGNGGEHGSCYVHVGLGFRAHNNPISHDP